MSKEHLNLYSFDNKKELKMKYIRTPKEIWEELSSEFVFTVDACASDKNHLVDKYWTKENSALDKDWNNEIIYCHPMYDSAIPKFIKKAYESNCLCVFLLPSSTNSVYFHQYFWDNKNFRSRDNIQLRFLEKPKGLYGFKFATDDGIEPETGYLRPLMVVVMDNRK
tara:strand:+ start:56 stop:553 length:498 start_codon:yes stop_codon:yes gene_type:complete